MQDPASLSLWHDTMPAGEWEHVRPPLEGDAAADVVIVGAGFTGLWTAYYLSQHEPALRITIVDAHVVGFGASGRNGGWCSALLPMNLEAIAADHGDDAARRMQGAMHATVDEVARVAATERIDCHLAKGGYVHLARNPAQRERLRGEVAQARRFGFGEEDLRWLDPDEARVHVGATDVHGATYTPHCAAIHPARLARGLARTVERRGLTIHEHTPVVRIGDRQVSTPYGRITARHVVCATEAFTVTLPGRRRDVAPFYSLMIATEPLPPSVFDSIGLARRETFNDARRMIIYGQRTADDRLAFGGRGAPYHYGSRIAPGFDRDDRVHDGLHHALRELFPALGDARITHRWGGAVAAARDWWCSVGYDRTTGIGRAGGYLGDGVATANLAGRTLADLITGRLSPLVRLPWVDHRSRRWEPEPLRWLGINALLRLPNAADRTEQRTGRADRWRGALLDRLTNQ